MTPKPRIKLSKMPVTKGALVEVTALVSHLMSASVRSDGARPVARKRLDKVTCVAAGKLVFAADLRSGISANPFLRFKFRAESSGPVVVTWIDEDGEQIVGKADVTVAS